MKYSLEFDEEADVEFMYAYLWYENQQKGLGERFIDYVERCLQTIAIHPQYFAIKKGNFREAKVKVFPYLIVYQVFEDESIIHIAAIYHGHRNPVKKYRKRK